MVNYLLCKNCNRIRPVEHIYCYVCGERLYLPAPRKQNGNSRKYLCRFCGQEFTPKDPRQVTCNDYICRKLSLRLRVHNSYRRKLGLSELETFERRLCSICGNLIPLDKISNSVVKFCSTECARIASCNASKKYYNDNAYELLEKSKIRKQSNGKVHTPSMQ